mmetsp:Transcript_13922/g.19054  ORF Transcript_13922/g.19054 Transcript_13922/m.19054 type:complete len:144 (-) Transcript_13922:345-776(-)|eukprot:CAMPEP_0185727504 /NCGR_PEP_ID=MMETSP1171-20130828/3168_1 /TAXON_ID=374046 /ORGANISM="Helicotheca tamensis, Strain CCMP826" /LENGTH=143 /DNA_ID=CAMNT_0028396085 /DNA_START=108 /DNA_END=539 /DNA_ORIENTATION=-
MAKFMKSIALLALAVFLVANPASAEEQVCKAGDCPDGIDPSCPPRDHIIVCAGEHLDHNKNKKLDRHELEDAIASLPWLARGVLKILGSVDSIMEKCDYDKDGAISMDYDMEAAKETCLATCFKRKAFKSAFFPECDLLAPKA